MSPYLRQIGVTAGVALVAAGLTTGVLAQAGGESGSERGRRTHAGAGLRGLDLTDAQRQQIQEIRQTHRDEMQKAAERLRAAHQTQRDAVRATPVDEGRIRATSDALAAAMTDMAVLRARIHEQTLSVLTPEQQERAKALWSERGAGFRGKGRMGGPRGGPRHGR